MVISFDLDGCAGCRVVLERSVLETGAGPEGAFLARAGRIDRHRDGFSQALQDLAAAAGIRWIVAVRNPALVLDDTLAERLGAAVARLDGLGHAVSIAAAGGLTTQGRRVAALYSADTPFLPVERLALPLADPMPDLWIAHAGFVRGLGAIPAEGAETLIALAGWLEGLLAVFLPELSAGIAGPFASRDTAVQRRALETRFADALPGETVPTLAGPVPLPSEPAPGRRSLAGTIAAAVEAACEPISLSFVVRTRFERPHLLARLLTSISRARRDDMALEVVLSTDVAAATAEREHARSRASAPHLAIRLAVNEAEGHSRVANLVGGIRAARHRHIAILDDDDYIDLGAFDALAGTAFLGAEPLIFARSEAHDETWERTASGRHVLARSVPRDTYPACAWRQAFAGVNTVPVCAMIAPRERLVARLGAFDLAHDLSEDYALSLLVLTDPALPPIVELDATFAHISIRGGAENSMTMADRRPWAADIARHLADLAGSPAVAGPGLWRVLARASGPGTALERDALEASQREVARLRREIALLSAERRRLVRLLSDNPAAADPPAPRRARAPSPSRRQQPEPA